VANLTSPIINWGGPAEPTSVAVIVPFAQIADPDVIVYTGVILTMPAVNQLVPPAPTPDAGLFVFQRSAVDSSGDVLTDARCEVRRAEDNVLADIFEDRDGLTQKSNPFFVDDEGFARFYAAAGLYTVRAFTGSFERILENVLLGVRLEDMPDLTPLVTPIIEALIEPVLEEIDEQIAAVPEIVKFSVSAGGLISDAPDGWTATTVSSGRRRITHNRSTSNYNVKLTVWDPGSDRLYSAMMIAKTSDTFDYQTRSIQDEAANDGARVDIEITFG